MDEEARNVLVKRVSSVLPTLRFESVLTVRITRSHEAGDSESVRGLKTSIFHSPAHQKFDILRDLYRAGINGLSTTIYYLLMLVVMCVLSFFLYIFTALLTVNQCTGHSTYSSSQRSYSAWSSVNSHLGDYGGTG
jgi:hypothetical protein